MYDRPQRDADCSSKGDWKGMENVSVQDIVLATGGVLLSGDDGVMLNKIRLDSRQVETGDLFVPIIGQQLPVWRALDAHTSTLHVCLIFRAVSAPDAITVS